jgi:hypothetical protein
MRTTRMIIGEAISDDLNDIVARNAGTRRNDARHTRPFDSRRRRRTDGDSDHRLAESGGLSRVPREQGLSAIPREHPTHVGWQLCRKDFREQNYGEVRAMFEWGFMNLRLAKSPDTERRQYNRPLSQARIEYHI